MKDPSLVVDASTCFGNESRGDRDRDGGVSVARGRSCWRESRLKDVFDARAEGKRLATSPRTASARAAAQRLGAVRPARAPLEARGTVAADKPWHSPHKYPGLRHEPSQENSM